MSSSELGKFMKLVRQYQRVLWIAALILVCCTFGSFTIYYNFKGHPKEVFWFQIADFLKTIAEAIISTILIGGGLGGVVNFIFEEQKKNDEAIKERLLSIQEAIRRKKAIRSDFRRRLQKVHDDVELARVLIKSHRSGKTYGETIRNLIMPSNIALQDIKQQLLEMKEISPIKHHSELQVSLTYMSAYLSVMIEEFSRHYLDIAMVQNYQENVAQQRRVVFTEVVKDIDTKTAEDARLAFLEKADQRMKKIDIPERLGIVWEAMGRLDYVWDFIADIRDGKGVASKYQTHFVDHHFHCLRLLLDKGNDRNERICRRKGFVKYLELLETLIEKKYSEAPITKHDSLTRTIMIESLGFDFDE